VLGEIPTGRGLCRNGAKPDDIIYVSGTLGDGAAALHQIQHQDLAQNTRLTERFYQPKPQIELGLGLVNYASACIDISDGLVADLSHLCKASSVSASINSQSLPIHADIKQAYSKQVSQWALTGGDDYQLCFTVPSIRQEQFERWACSAKFVVTAIGKIAALDHNQNYLKIDNQTSSITAGGYSHFR
jgi:thiamine-monophosphate kinase